MAPSQWRPSWKKYRSGELNNWESIEWRYLLCAVFQFEFDRADALDILWQANLFMSHNGKSQYDLSVCMTWISHHYILRQFFTSTIPIIFPIRSVINNKKPLWLRSPKECSELDYSEFYKQTFNAYDEPAAHAHFSVEGNVDFKVILYSKTLI